MQRGRIGLDGAKSELCDLSGRSLTTSQVERTLRVFSTASTVDLSNNEIDRVPAALPPEVLVLDMSFNLIADAEGIERFQCLEELHLAFNRLADVSVLELCPRLLRVNLSGNRLMNTKGLETLICLKQLDISENLVEHPDALRPLSLNQHLTHLTIRGNPVSQKADYRVLLLAMIPSVLMVDDKKIRATTKSRAPDGPTAKSLSYSRLYDDKKHYVIRKPPRRHPGTRAPMVLPGEATTQYDASMFLRPASEPIQERLWASQEALEGLRDDLSSFRSPPPPAPSVSSMTMNHSPEKPVASGPYVSLYERLAQSGSVQGFKSNAPPSRPIVNVKSNVTPGSHIKRKDEIKMAEHAASLSTQHDPTPKNSLKGTRPSSASRLPRGTTARCQTQSQRRTPAHEGEGDRTQHQPGAEKQFNTPSSVPSGPVLNEKQRKVLNVINNLIQHKRQTVHTLGRPSDGGAMVSPPRAGAFRSHVVR